MTHDPIIREQSYRYFLQEAPELLQVLEQDLLSLREDYSINKVHNLMRTTHTMKGAAASIGLETIKTVAHSLEDIFKALFNPNLSIDAEVEALLFEGYECLRLPITAEVTGGQVNDAEILDRTAAVFAQLQEKLGNCFASETYIPSSVELGFDVTQSIFEIGVSQRLEEIAAAVASANPQVVVTTLRTQIEVFQGLAESLNLPGFGAIAQAAIAALDAHPAQVLPIAHIVLADFQAGQAAVLNGDRTQGGQPSLALQQLSGLHTSSTELREGEGKGGKNILPALGQTDSSILLSPYEAPDSDERESVTQPELDWVTSTTDSQLSVINTQNNESVNPFLELIWGGETVLDSQMSEQGSLAPADSISATSSDQETLNPTDRETLTPAESAPRKASLPASATESVSLLLSGAKGYGDNASSPTPEASDPTSISQKDQVSLSRTVRIDVEHLDHLNYSIGELLTNQNHQSLQNEQLQAAVRSLLARLKQHQQLLSQLQDWSDRLFVVQEQQRIGELGVPGGNRVQWGIGKAPSHAHDPIQNPKPTYRTLALAGRVTYKRDEVQSEDGKIQNRFDSLELDRYSESQILVQLLLEDAVQ